MAAIKGGDADECDGVFTGQDDALDEVDSSKTITLLDASRVFPTHYLDIDGGDNSWRSVDDLGRLRMVHPAWGKRVSRLVEGSAGHMVLITMDNDAKLNEHLIKKLSATLHRRFEEAVRIIRYDSMRVLAYIWSEEIYRSFAHDLMTGEFEADCIFTRLEPVSECRPPPCLLEVRTGDGAYVHELLTQAVLPLSSAFTFTTINNQPGLLSADLNQPTSIALTMLFDGANQRHACKAQQVLSQSPWQQVQLPESVTKDLDIGTRYFRGSNDSLPMWGLQDGCAQAGVRLAVFVRNISKYPDMQSYYSKALGVPPLLRESSSSAMRSATYALSSLAELAVVSHPDFHTSHSANLSVCIQVKEALPIDGAQSIAPGYWQGHDPEGNSVIFFSVLK